MLIGQVDGDALLSLDVDVDGDEDVVAMLSDGVYPKVAWFENVAMREPGDANEDGRFDQLDIVQVLQAGKYLTNETASWSEGDWNGDGLFNQLDIIVALQDGNYLQATP